MKAYQNQGIDVANTTVKSFNIWARDTQLCSKGQNRFVEYTHFTVEENKTLKSQLLSQGHSTTTTVANTTATTVITSGESESHSAVSNSLQPHGL